jgi:PTS system glucose-specific IIC component
MLKIFKKKKENTIGVVSENKKKSGRTKEVIAKLSKGLMLPIATLPIAGLFLGIGNAIAANTTAGTFINVLGLIIMSIGNFIFGNLPVLFAIAIAITFTKDAGVSALAAVTG